MADWEDYYQILGVSPDASAEDIKETYRYRVNILHPDRLMGVPESVRRRAEKELKKINQAYEVLGDPQKRQEYHSEWLKRKVSLKQVFTPKPKPIVYPQRIRFSDFEPGEKKQASFIIRNLGSPYKKIWFSNPDSWVKVVRWASLTTSDELPMRVEIEAKGEDWGKSYSEYIRVKLDDEETQVRVTLQTKPEPVIEKVAVSKVAEAKLATPPPLGIRLSLPDWGKWLIGLAALSLIIVVISQFWPSGSPSETPPTPPVEASTLRQVLPDTIEDGDWLGDESGFVFSTKSETEDWGERFRLYTMNFDGTGEEKIDADWAALNIGSTDHVAPLVSPDDKQIAFVVDSYEHSAAIYVMNTDGTNVRRVSPLYDSIAFAWSSEETLVCWGGFYVFGGFDVQLLYSPEQGELYVVDINSGHRQELDSPPKQLLRGKFVSLSPLGGDLVVDLLRHYPLK